MHLSDPRHLETLARKARSLILRCSSKSRSSHVGGNLSSIDLILASLAWMESKGKQGNRFHLSKGHSALAFYAAKCVLGELTEEQLMNYGSEGSPFGAHLNSNKSLGVELGTGSLGHALAFALGRQIGARTLDEDAVDIVCISDGELNEGSIWEAIQLAGHLKTGNLVVTVDNNRLQAMGATKKILDLEPLQPKFEAFGWNAVNVDGHDFEELILQLELANQTRHMPSALICNTVKGKGVSFMENQVSWHYRPPGAEDLEKALRDLA